MKIVKNVNELIKLLKDLAPANKGAIVGLGVNSPKTIDGYVIGGSGDNYITGYLYKAGEGFSNEFRVATSYHSISDAEYNIKRVRRVIDPLY